MGASGAFVSAPQHSAARCECWCRYNGPRFRGGVDTDGIAVWTHHLKGGSSKGDGGTGLILGNLERSLFRVRVWGWAWL